MADSDDDVLQKADALMRRHRVFVAGAAPQPDEASTDDADDVPVLTEVVADVPAEPAAAGASVSIDPARLQQALTAELDAWLDEQLPAHIMRVLDGITDQMIGQLSEKARGELLPRLQALLEAAPGKGSDEG